MLLIPDDNRICLDELPVSVAIGSAACNIYTVLLTPFCVGVTAERQQPISVVIEILHYTIILDDLTFQCDSCVNIITVYS